MKINNIYVKGEGYAYCKSSFYSAHDALSNSLCYTFSRGVNRLIGEIDSGCWAVSYLLSMYKHCPEDFVLLDEPKIVADGKQVSLNDLSSISCYMDKSNPMFCSDASVKELVIHGLKQSKSNYSCADIRSLFYIDSERFERAITGVGNEIFKVMAAIGFSYEREIFCFPWLSQRRFERYHKNLIAVLDVLESFKKIIILPVGYHF
ncbi:MAG: hypothetical protein IKA64_00650 [Clostridia bacterium]|nr:hypothetical protein [Clostridia bacterium]